MKGKSTTRRLLPLLAALIAFHGAPADAQRLCGPYDSHVRQLQTKYGETRRGQGLRGSTILEVWASDEPPYTWTILEVYPGGKCCVRAVGDNWQDGAQEPPGEPI
jgi:hypothetical protein